MLKRATVDLRVVERFQRSTNRAEWAPEKTDKITPLVAKKTSIDKDVDGRTNACG